MTLVLFFAFLLLDLERARAWLFRFIFFPTLLPRRRRRRTPPVLADRFPFFMVFFPFFLSLLFFLIASQKYYADAAQR